MANIPPPPVTRPGAEPTTKGGIDIPAPIRKAATEAKWFMLERPEQGAVLVGIVGLLLTRNLAVSALSAAATYGGSLYIKGQAK